MGAYTTIARTGTKQSTLLAAVEDLQAILRGVETGTGTIVDIGIADIGPGKYWQSYVLHEA